MNFCGLFLGQAQGLVVFIALYQVLGSSRGPGCSFPSPFTLHILGSQSGHLDEKASSKLCSLSAPISTSSQGQKAFFASAPCLRSTEVNRVLRSC